MSCCGLDTLAHIRCFPRTFRSPCHHNNLNVFLFFSLSSFVRLAAVRLQMTTCTQTQTDAYCRPCTTRSGPPDTSTTRPPTTTGRCTPAPGAETPTRDSTASAGTSGSSAASTRSSSVPYATKSPSTNTTCCCT